jgi:hypothetical protein
MNSTLSTSAPRPELRLGFWAAVATSALTAATFAIAIATPPRSGPYAVIEEIRYPYTAVAAYVPREYLWMTPAILASLAFLILAACLHAAAPAHRRLFSLLGLNFATLSFAALTVDYVVQLHVMQPSLLAGETDGLSVWSQYNPHGVFIALEEVGHLSLSGAFLFLALSISARSRAEKAARWLFVVAALLGPALLVGLQIAYGYDLDYRFEVAIITVNFTTLIAGGWLLARAFSRERAQGGAALAAPSD